MPISPEAVQRDRVQHDLWDRTAKVAGRLNRAHAELVDIAVDLLEGRHWGDGGFRSPEHYFVVRAGLSPAHARDVVAVARRRAELTVIAESVASGELSMDQAAVVAHHVPASHQRSVGELARHMTVPQLRRAVSRHAFTTHGAPAPGDRETALPQSEDPRAESQRRALAAPDLSMHYDRDGRFQLRYSAPAVVGALVEQSVKEAKDALFLATPGNGNDGVARQGGADGAPTYADGLEEIARRSLDTVTTTSRSAHYRVYLHLSTDGAWVNSHGAVPAHAVHRLLGDGVTAQPVWEKAGHPVAVGRAMRILPDRARRLVRDRDRGCRFPGCTSTRFTEVHHLVRWADGGTTDPPNQVSLCPFHHDAIDRGDYAITGNPDPRAPQGLTITNRYGHPIRPPRPAELRPSPGGEPGQPPEHPAYQPPSGERARWADIEIPPDHDLPPAATSRGAAGTAEPPIGPAA
jgi:hypothetical protein